MMLWAGLSYCFFVVVCCCCCYCSLVYFWWNVYLEFERIYNKTKHISFVFYEAISKFSKPKINASHPSLSHPRKISFEREYLIIFVHWIFENLIHFEVRARFCQMPSLILCKLIVYLLFNWSSESVLWFINIPLARENWNVCKKSW